jgi:hypothetical protein
MTCQWGGGRRWRCVVFGIEGDYLVLGSEVGEQQIRMLHPTAT